MFCNKCGRRIDSGIYCSECAAAENSQRQPAPTYQQPIIIKVETHNGYTPAVKVEAPAGYAPNIIVETETAPATEAPESAYTSESVGQGVENQLVSLGYVPPEKGSRMAGFGKALTAVILASIGYVLAALGSELTYYLPLVALWMELIALPFGVVPMIFGISSIRLFKSRKNTAARPVATFVLGIIGLSMAAYILLTDLLALYIIIVGV